MQDTSRPFNLVASSSGSAVPRNSTSVSALCMKRGQQISHVPCRPKCWCCVVLCCVVLCCVVLCCVVLCCVVLWFWVHCCTPDIDVWKAEYRAPGPSDTAGYSRVHWFVQDGRMRLWGACVRECHASSLVHAETEQSVFGSRTRRGLCSSLMRTRALWSSCLHPLHSSTADA